MKANLATLTLSATLATLAAPALAEDCGTISIAEMNWASAGVAAWVDKIILEEGYGCDVDLVTGDTMPTFTSMNEKSEPDMAPELWVNAVKTALDQAVKEDRLVITAPLLSDGGVEGWWVPKYIVDENPEITTVEAALKRPDLFPAPEDASRGAVYSCPSGWNCQLSTENLFRAYDAEEKGFDLIDPGSAAGLDGSIANAYERKQGWLGYYWAPTAILGKYEMVSLDWGVPNDRANWDSCTSQANCVDPVPNAYPISDVYTVVTKEFSEKAGVAIGYVETRKWDNQTVGKVLAWMDENQGSNEDSARYFLETYKDMWTAWVAPEVAAKVEASL